MFVQENIHTISLLSYITK